MTRERGILMYTVELRCSRREKKEKGMGGGEGELQSVPNRWRIQCCFLPRREARLLERRHRLTFDPFLLRPLLACTATFWPSFANLSTILFFLFARKSREYHPSFFLYVFSFLLLPSLSLSFLLPKNIKIKLEGEKIGNFQRVYRFFTIKILNRSKIFDMFPVTSNFRQMDKTGANSKALSRFK